MSKTNPQCIFGGTPRPEENKEQNKTECIFKKHDNKDNNPIKITSSLFQSQLVNKEENKIDNNNNNNQNKNNDFDNDLNSMQCKTFTKKKKKNFLNTSINVNIMDFNDPSSSSNNNNHNNNEININNNIVINNDNNIIINKNNNTILNNNNENNIFIRNENNKEDKKIEINNNVKIQNKIEDKKIENIFDSFRDNRINNINNIHNYNINLIHPKNNMNNINIENNNNNIINNVNNNYNNNINKNIINNNINNNNNKIININGKTSKESSEQNIKNNYNLDLVDKEENDKKTQVRKNSRHKYSQEEIKKKKLEEELSRDQVKDHLKCYICYNQIKKPRMCKYCNKLACEECLKNWLSNKNKCAFCRTKMRFEDTVYIPIMEELSTFFMNEVEKEPVNYDSYNSFVISGNDEMNPNDNNENGNENKCQTHNNPYEYYCVQCNQNYCPKCLIFINEDVKIHENHIIIPLNKLENMQIKETIDEFRKLDISKKNVDELIKICNLKIKEMEIEKNQNLVILDMIKNHINDKLDNYIKTYNKKYNSLKSRDDAITRAFETTPIALQNIVNSKDHGQGEKIYEHIKSINKGYERIVDINSVKLKNNFIESFSTEQIEFILPDGGKFTENLEICLKQSNHFIPDNEFKILIKYLKNNINFNIIIKNTKKNYHQDKIKYYGYIIIQNKKYDCEYVVTEDKINFDKHILTAQISYNNFISFKDENNKIRFKIYIMKHERR